MGPAPDAGTEAPTGPEHWILVGDAGDLGAALVAEMAAQSIGATFVAGGDAAALDSALGGMTGGASSTSWDLLPMVTWPRQRPPPS